MGVVGSLEHRRGVHHTMLFYGPNGFAFSPVVKCFMFTTAGLSLLAPVLAPGTSFNLQIPLVLRGQLWRLITSNLVFSTPAELLFGSLLLYYSRVLERHMGIQSFSAFTAIAFCISTLIQVAVGALLPKYTNFASGPYGLIFAMMVLAFYRLPRLRSFNFFGMAASDKLFIHLIAAQLMLNDLPGSFSSAVVGLIVGQLYVRDVVGLQSLSFPYSVRQQCARIWGGADKCVALNETIFQQAVNAQNEGANGDQLLPIPVAAMQGMMGVAGVGAGAVQQPQLPPPSEELIEQLVGLTGSTRTAVLAALQRSGNDPDAATNILLDQM